MSDVRFYVDVHFNADITDALRERGVDVLTAQDDQRQQLSDERLLQRATELERVMVTFDNDYWTLAHQWHGDGRPFPGIVLIPSDRLTVGEAIDALEEIAKAMTSDEWVNRIDRLPLSY